MSKIQLITYNEMQYANYHSDIEINNFNNLKSLDNYDINVFDLSNSNIWRNKSNTENKPTEITISTSDFRSIKTMINNSKKTNIVICLPQNLQYHCKYYDENRYYQLKDMIPTFSKILEQLIPFNGFNIIYENNINQIGGELIPSSFYFSQKEFENLIFSKDSEKVTSIRKSNIILTTIDLVNKEKPEVLLEFLKEIKLIKENIDFPSWLYKYEFDDDQTQKNNIIQAKKQIQIQKEIIEKANEKLQKNLHFKSILVTNSDDLVNVVFEILEFIFDISLKDFNDEKREDFLFKKNSLTYIGEIKGVTSNVKYENISQLEVHYSKYMDKLQEENKEEKIKKILIMNYERTKEIEKRDNINFMQIELAEKNNTLIIDTKSLLTIYEKLLQGILNKSQVIDYIKSNSGIIDIEKI